MIPARIAQCEGLGDRITVAKVTAEHNVFDGSGKARILAQAAYGQHEDSAIGNRIHRIVIAGQHTLAGQVLRKRDLFAQRQVVGIVNLQERQIGAGRVELGICA